MVAPTPARAAASSVWAVFHPDRDDTPHANGRFVWLNQSVQVGGSLYVTETWGWCGAVVFTAYDGSGRQVARAVRPKDGEYYCTRGWHGFEFTLDPAGSPSGGIRRIQVHLWAYEFGVSGPRIIDSENYWRP